VIPFLHLGPLTIPTFGLMVACAMLAAFFVLRADLERRGLASSGKKDASNSAGAASPKSANAEAELLIAIPCMVGLAGAKLYHLLESPSDFFAHPLALLISPYGFAWFGGLLAGFAAFVWVGRRQRIPLFTLLDTGSPAAALGYGIGRIGCFLSGDGDYGIPTSLPWGMSFPNGLVPTTAARCATTHFPPAPFSPPTWCSQAWPASWLNSSASIPTLSSECPTRKPPASRHSSPELFYGGGWQRVSPGAEI
jgi:phosphatidylglycerol:prolipoprotein diacylglycerol transferase